MGLARGDFALGLAAMALAAAYLFEVERIPVSLLSDAVGAAGVPRAVGWTLAAVGILLCVRSVWRAPAAAAGRITWRPHLQALGLLCILALYVVLAPGLGYALATALLVAAGAAYAGAPRGKYVVIVPVLAGALLWALFVLAFGIPMPGAAWLGAH